jgi:carboxypeptidase Taq
MRPRLVTIRDTALSGKPAPSLEGIFLKDLQMSLSKKIAGLFGYDFNRGGLDLAVHPFSSGSGDDVRITTRVEEKDPFNCLYSTIHEVGHATYEQNINNDYLLTPLGSGVSMGVHESQSRIYENQIGRSQAFTQFLFHEMLKVFGDFGIKSAGEFYRCVNAIKKGYIRTEADEVQYNLHIMLRYELEQALINGSLEVKDLEVAWNDSFQRDFGYSIDKPSNGVLQDVHWSVGLFGYFPTYSLGNVYAGCLEKVMRRELPDLDTDFLNGNVQRATNWLGDNLQRYGGLRDPELTISHATNEIPNEEPLLNYLEKKFSSLA